MASHADTLYGAVCTTAFAFPASAHHLKSLRMATVNGCLADMIISAWHILPQSHSSEVLAPHNLLFGALTTTTLRMVSGKSQNTMTVLSPHWACPNHRAGRVNNRVNNQIEA